jgi:hypothetical protein
VRKGDRNKITADFGNNQLDAFKALP